MNPPPSFTSSARIMRSMSIFKPLPVTVLTLHKTHSFVPSSCRSRTVELPGAAGRGGPNDGAGKGCQVIARESQCGCRIERAAGVRIKFEAPQTASTGIVIRDSSEHAALSKVDLYLCTRVISRRMRQH